VIKPVERDPRSKAELVAAQPLFDELCAARQRWMVESMGAWADATLIPEVSAWLSSKG
jgi:hypothetical protein